MLSRQADRRTIEFGMVMCATAIVRTNSISSIFASGVSASMSPRTVPLNGTSALIGTLPGCSVNVASAWMKPTRSTLLDRDQLPQSSTHPPVLMLSKVHS